MSSSSRRSGGGGGGSNSGGGSGTKKEAAAVAVDAPTPTRLSRSAAAAAPVPTSTPAKPSAGGSKRKLVVSLEQTDGVSDDEDEDEEAEKTSPTRASRAAMAAAAAALATAPAAKRARTKGDSSSQSQSHSQREEHADAQLKRRMDRAAKDAAAAAAAASASASESQTGRSGFLAAAAPRKANRGRKAADPLRAALDEALARGGKLRCPDCQSTVNARGLCPAPSCAGNGPVANFAPAITRVFKKKAKEVRCDAYPCAYVLREDLTCSNKKCSKYVPGSDVEEEEEEDEKEDQRATASSTPAKRKGASVAPATAPAATSTTTTTTTVAYATSKGRVVASKPDYSDPLYHANVKEDDADSDFEGAAAVQRRGRGRPRKSEQMGSDGRAFSLLSAPASAPRGPGRPPKSSYASSSSARDADLALALSLSLAEQSSVAAGAGSSSFDSSASPDSMYDEDLTHDPRHRDTLQRGLYVVHPVAKTPEGFRAPGEIEDQKPTTQNDADVDMEEEDGAAEKPNRKRGSSQHNGAASPVSSSEAAVAPPVLLRSGFASSYPGETAASVSARAAAYNSVWVSLRRELLASLRGGHQAAATANINSGSSNGAGGNQEQVFDSLVRFAQTVFGDEGHEAASSSLSLAYATAQQVATNIVHPPALLPAAVPSASTSNGVAAVAGSDSDSGAIALLVGPPTPFRSHSLPVALVHAGMVLEDHALLMAELASFVAAKGEKQEATKRAAALATKQRKKRSSTTATAAAAAAKTGHNYGGASELKKLGISSPSASGRRASATAAADSSSDEDDGSDNHDSGEEDEHTNKERSSAGAASSAGAGGAQVPAPFPTPLPFVATLPAQPQNLLALFQALYACLVDGYPAPGTLASGSVAGAGATSAAAAALSSLPPAPASSLASRKAAERQSVEWIVEQMALWMQAHRNEQRAKYYRWNSAREKALRQQAQQQATAAAADSNAVAPMELDDDEDAAVPAASSASKARSKKQASTTSNGSSNGHGAVPASVSAAAAAAVAASLPSSSPSVPSPPPAVSYPSSIYPRLLLLLPSLDRFPPAILTDFLLLLQEHPVLRRWDTLFPFVMVWPVAVVAGSSGAGSATGANAGALRPCSASATVHSLLPKLVLDRVWFGTFSLPSPGALMASLLSEVFQARSGRLRAPLVLGSAPMGFVLRQFFEAGAGLTNVLRQIQFALLEQMDAEGGTADADASVSVTPADGKTAACAASVLSADESERICPLSASFCRAWFRQAKRASRIAAVGSSSSATTRTAAASAELERILGWEDPLDRWVADLTPAEMRLLARLPSVREDSTAAATADAGVAAASGDAFRAQLRPWLLELDAHRLTQWRAAQVLLHLCQQVGVFSLPSATAAHEHGLTREMEVWLHTLSHPVFASRSDKAPGTGGASQQPLQLHSSSRRRFCGARVDQSLDVMLVSYAHSEPSKLHELLKGALGEHIKQMRAQLGELEAQDATVRDLDASSSPATLVLRRALERWEALLNWTASAAEVHSLLSGSGGASSSGAGASSSSKKATGRGQALVGLTANVGEKKLLAGSVLAHVHRFCSLLLTPLRSMPLGELIAYDKRASLVKAFDPQAEAAVHRALAQPELYLDSQALLDLPVAWRARVQQARERAAVASNGGGGLLGLSLLSASGAAAGASLFHSAHLAPDVCVAFDIFARVNGLFVNLRDWFDAFKAAMRGGANAAAAPTTTEEEKEAPPPSGRKKVAARKVKHHMGASAAAASSSSASGAAAGEAGSAAPPTLDPLSDTALQARFVQCLSTLTSLGYSKITNRRIDHVCKLTMHRLL